MAALPTSNTGSTSQDGAADIPASVYEYMKLHSHENLVQAALKADVPADILSNSAALDALCSYKVPKLGPNGSCT